MLIRTKSKQRNICCLAKSTSLWVEVVSLDGAQPFLPSFDVAVARRYSVHLVPIFTSITAAKRTTKHHFQITRPEWRQVFSRIHNGGNRPCDRSYPISFERFVNNRCPNSSVWRALIMSSLLRRHLYIIVNITVKVRLHTVISRVVFVSWWML